MRDLLRKCLEAVSHNSSSLSLDVWVVDNSSGDGSGEMVRREFPQVALISNTVNLGSAKAANQALAQAEGEFLVLLNPVPVQRVLPVQEEASSASGP